MHWKTTFTFVVTCGMALLLAGAEPDVPKGPATTQSVEAKGQQLASQGSDALYRGDYAKAIELLQKAIEADPGKTGYRVDLARAYRFAGNDKAAQGVLEAVLKTTPDQIEAGQVLADIYSQQENWKGVVDVIEPLLKYRHDYAAYHVLAQAKYNLGDMEKARKYFEEAIRLNPRSASDHYDLGNIYLAGNFFALAADAYQQALGLGLQTPVLHYKLGSAYFNLRNYFGEIAEVNVKAGQVGTISGDWYIIEPVPGSTERFRCAPAASAVYQVALAIADGIGDRPDIRFLQANIYLNAGRFQQANAMFKAIEPSIAKDDKALFYFYYAQSAFGIGQYDAYLKLLQQAIALDAAAYGATLADAYVKVADQYNQAGDLTNYIKYLSLAVDQSPQNASLHLQLGNAYQDDQQFAKAVTQWKMVLDLEPDHPQRLELFNRIAKSSNLAATQPATKAN